MPIDYSVPGCPPESARIAEVVGTLIAGLEGVEPLPPRGSVLGAGHSTVCDECSRVRHAKLITAFRRIQELPSIDPELCLLEQGIPCNGPATRDGCGALCPAVSAPCIGCYGPADGVIDAGARLLSAFASVVDASDAVGIERILDGHPRPGRPVLPVRPRGVAPAVRPDGPRRRPGSGRTGATPRGRSARRPPMTRLTIDPITRLEGHGRIEIFLDDAGEVERTYFQVPELRGFERFCVGRPVEEMATLTNRICGVCPEAHHMAAAKAADAVYEVDPPRPAKLLRELLYSAFFVADHTTHFYVLSGPDFIVGPEAPVAERNILGVLHKVGAGGRGQGHRGAPQRATPSSR